MRAPKVVRWSDHDPVVARIREALEDAGRDTSRAVELAAAMRRNHARYHDSPRPRCMYCEAAARTMAGYRVTGHPQRVDPLPDDAA